MERLLKISNHKVHHGPARPSVPLFQKGLVSCMCTGLLIHNVQLLCRTKRGLAAQQRRTSWKSCVACHRSYGSMPVCLPCQPSSDCISGCRSRSCEIGDWTGVRCFHLWLQLTSKKASCIPNPGCSICEVHGATRKFGCALFHLFHVLWEEVHAVQGSQWAQTKWAHWSLRSLGGLRTAQCLRGMRHDALEALGGFCQETHGDCHGEVRAS
mmetsp:Transcript_43629/g.53536  ORF Transcript_43629/g.53536 Transcript_43629/m.53536 type:complete len:211 (+) Transcript_43629:65-697(+)